MIHNQHWNTTTDLDHQKNATDATGTHGFNRQHAQHQANDNANQGNIS